MQKTLRLALSLFLFTLVWSGSVWSAMTIEIIGGAAKRIPIAIVPFGLPGKADDPAEIISADLHRSGLFQLLETRDVSPVPREPQDIRYPQWKAKGADAIVIGQVLPLSGNRYEVRFRLLDVVKGQQLAGFSYSIAPQGLRAVAHKIADVIHEKLTGEPGAYSGRIAYVLKGAGRYELQVADVDGYNAFTVARSPEAIISPAWSPDGKRLAIVLSRDASSQIYLINANGGEPQRFTRGGALDTEPVFSPDGKWLYFTSDRGGSPQIYRAPLDAGGAPQRLTFEGGYNVSPTVSPDGRTLAYVHRRDGRFLVAVMDLATGQTQVLTDTDHDESPSFAPNGRTILYATLVGGRGLLATVSVDGRVRQRLSQSGDLREPAWAPVAN